MWLQRVIIPGDQAERSGKIDQLCDLALDRKIRDVDPQSGVLATTHQVSENSLRQSTTTPVEGNTFAGAELITRTADVSTLSAASDPLAGRCAIGSPLAQHPAVARLTG
jgi:hypothetical protein